MASLYEGRNLWHLVGVIRAARRTAERMGASMRRKLQTLLDEKVNPMVASHGGHIELLDYANGTAFVRMSGGCQGCGSAKATLRQGVEEAIFGAFPRVKHVVDLTDHASGSSPYYQPA